MTKTMENISTDINAVNDFGCLHHVQEHCVADVSGECTASINRVKMSEGSTFTMTHNEFLKSTVREQMLNP